GRAADNARVPLERAEPPAGRRLPDAYGAITGGGNELGAVPVEGHGLNDACMAAKHQHLPFARQVPDPDRAVGAGGGEPGPIRAERHAPHLAVNFMAFEGEDFSTGRRIQDLYHPGKATCRQPGPVRAECDPDDHGWVQRDRVQVAVAETLE